MNRVYHLATQWLAEVGAFVLLPLIVYIIVFLALGVDRTKLIELPEWMFVSIILFGESTLKSIAYYKDLMLSAKDASSNLSGYSLKMNRELSVGIVGIVVSCPFSVNYGGQQKRIESLEIVLLASDARFHSCSGPFLWEQDLYWLENG